MMFLFAYLGQFNSPPGWPIQLMHRTEVAFIVAAVASVLLASVIRGQRAEFLKYVIALVGGVSASLGLIMPFELAPFFFDTRGEIMMLSIVLNLAYPLVAGLFFLLFLKIEQVRL